MSKSNSWLSGQYLVFKIQRSQNHAVSKLDCYIIISRLETKNLYEIGFGNILVLI